MHLSIRRDLVPRGTILTKGQNASGCTHSSLANPVMLTTSILVIEDGCERRFRKKVSPLRWCSECM